MRVRARWPGAAGGGESGENKGRAGGGAGLGSEFWFLWLLSSQLMHRVRRAHSSTETPSTSPAPPLTGYSGLEAMN